MTTEPQPQSEETKTSQEYVAMFADFQKQQLLQQARQKIASEQLAALILAPKTLWDGQTQFGDSLTVRQAVKTAVKLADLLIAELAETANK